MAIGKDISNSLVWMIYIALFFFIVMFTISHTDLSTKTSFPVMQVVNIFGITIILFSVAVLYFYVRTRKKEDY